MTNSWEHDLAQQIEDIVAGLATTESRRVRVTKIILQGAALIAAGIALIVLVA